MRILLDECIDEGLRRLFAGHDCQTVRYAGLKGLSNGKLLAAAEQLGFGVLVTVDQNMAHQQSLEGRKIGLVVLRSRTTNFEDLVPLIPEVLATIETMKPGDVVRTGNQ